MERCCRKRLASWKDGVHPFIGSRKGVKNSEETRKKLSESLTGLPRPKSRKPVLQFDLEGNFIQRFESGEIAVKELNLPNGASSHITMVCSDKYTRTTAYGFKWKYEN